MVLAARCSNKKRIYLGLLTGIWGYYIPTGLVDYLLSSNLVQYVLVVLFQRIFYKALPDRFSESYS